MCLFFGKSGKGLMNELKKKYGLLTAIAMVVGIVIGSGVFFKAETIHKTTGGDMKLGIMAWIIGGIIMLACAITFSIMAGKYEKVNGIVDYAEATVGSKYAYYIGWFMTTVLYPTLTSALAWLSARYTMVLFGSKEITGGTCMTLACFYLIASYAVNALSPVVAGKVQVSATVIKLIPLLLMAIVGTIAGTSNGLIVQNFSSAVEPIANSGQALFTAVVASAFAYEGWIVATSINAELKNAKRNLPIALTVGSLIIISVYVFYYIGLAGAVETKTLMELGPVGVQMAFNGIFGKTIGAALMAFIVVSCLGTLNGLMLGCTRGMYSIAVRRRGPAPHIFAQVDKVTNMPTSSSVVGLLICSMWLFYFYGANLLETPIFGVFCFDSSELPIVTLYALYIPIFVKFIFAAKGENPFRHIVMPLIACLSSAFMVFAACYAHGKAVIYYLIVFAVIMFIGAMFSKEKNI